LSISGVDLSEAEQSALKNVGFVEVKNDLVLKGKLEGKYYTAKGFDNASSFSRPYSITLVEDSSMPAPVKVALTPITVAADGVLWIGGSLLLGLFCAGQTVTTGGKCFPGGL
jgi:hypothetical protein